MTGSNTSEVEKPDWVTGFEELEARDRQTMLSLLTERLKYPQESHLALARRIVSTLRALENIDERDPQGQTALVIASVWGRLDICEVALQADADPDARDNYGRTAAAAYGYSCGEENCTNAPEEARDIFAAYGGGEVPAPYAVRFQVRPRPDAAESLRRMEFTKAVSEALVAAGLPALRMDSINAPFRRVWLLGEEVERARAAFAPCAEAAGYGGKAALGPFDEAEAARASGHY